MNVGTLYATLTIRDDGFNQGMARAESTAQRTDRTIQGATRSTQQLGAAGGQAGRQVASGTQSATTGANTLTAALGKAKAAAGLLGVAFTAKAAVGFFTDAVQNARALGAQGNQMNAIFGKSRGAIEEWGSTAKDTLKMSQREAQGAAIQFATFGSVAGYVGGNLVKFSTEMTKLAAETASFNGTAIDEVISAMGSAFQGEAIPMRKYGLLLSDTALRAVALEHGIIQSNQQLTAQQKVLATEIALKEQLAVVEGDIENSNGKLGQSLKFNRAKYEEVSAAIGQKLMPMVNGLVKILGGQGLDALSATSTGLGYLGKTVGVVTSAFNGLPGPIKATLGALVAGKLAVMLFGNAALAARAKLSALMGTAVLQGAYGVARLNNAFTTAAAGATRFGAAGRVAAGGLGVLKAGASGLMGALGGPWGLVITAATLGVMKFFQAKREAKQRADELKASVSDLGTSLAASGGQYTAQGEQAAQAALDTIKLADGTTTLREALDASGVSTAQAAKGLAGVGSAAKDTRKQLEELHKQQISEMSNWDKIKDAWSQYWGGDDNVFDKAANGEHNTLASNTLKGLDAADAQIKEKIASIGNAMESGGNFGKQASYELGVMTEALQELATGAGGAASQVDALVNALNSFRDDALTLENAQQSVDSATREIGTSLQEAKAAAQAAGQEFLTASGTVNTFSKAGESAADDMKDVGLAMDAAAAAAYQTAWANGDATGAIDAARSAAEKAKQQWWDNSIAAGANADELTRMAEGYDLQPDSVVTHLDVVGAQDANLLIEAFGNNVTSMPDDKTVIVKALSDDAKQALAGVKAGVEELPDGSFQITADTLALEAAFNRVRGQVDGMPKKPIEVAVEEKGAETVIGQLSRVNVLVEDQNGKDIVVTDNAEAALQHLNDLNVRTTTLDDGSIWILDNASEVASKIDRELQGKTTTGTHVVEEVRTSRGGGGTFADGGIRSFANGGINRLPTQAMIQQPRKNLVQWAEPETKGEAYIPLAESKRPRSEQILNTVANDFGYGMVPLDALKHTRKGFDLMRGDVTAFAEGGFGGNHGSMPETAAVTLSANKGINARGTGLVGAAGLAHMFASALGGNGFDTGGTSIPGMDDWGLEEQFRAYLASLAGIEANEHQLSADELRKLERDIEDGDWDLQRADIDIDKAKKSLHEAKTADKPDAYEIRSAEIAVEEAETKRRRIERDNAELAAKKAKAGDTPKAADLPEFKDWAKEQLFGPAPKTAEEMDQLRESIQSGIEAEEDAQVALEKAQIALGKAQTAEKPDADSIRDAEVTKAEAERKLARIRDDNARQADAYAAPARAASAGGFNSGGGSQSLSSTEQMVVGSVGSVAAGGESKVFNFQIGQIVNGPVTNNDPEQLLKPNTGDPIREAMIALGV
ncbi:hypothetical protein ACIGKR_23910 [Rhodococcus qingshengii]|uniref:hypothetical protein n=1 Tax=Rhodococcus qingshengii TaxID=334542 RepID=UPI0037C7E633